VHLSDAYERTVSGNESDPESGGLRILKISWEVVGKAKIGYPHRTYLFAHEPG
jgi:hypothetical protein